MKFATLATIVGAMSSTYNRLTMIVRHLLERNYNLMNRFFPALSIAILTSIFTSPTMFDFILALLERSSVHLFV